MTIASPAKLLGEYLILKGLGVRQTVANLPWSVVDGFMPDTPDNVIALYNTLGRDEGRIQKTGERIVKPGVMFRLRARTDSEVYAKAWAIARDLDTIHNYFLVVSDLGYRIEAVSRVGNPFTLGQEPNRPRIIYSLNVTVSLQEPMV